MKKNFTGGGFLALCFLLVASVATATPTCSSLVTLNPVDVAPGGNQLNSITCTEGAYLFSNFAYTVASGSGNPEIDISRNGVTTNGTEVDINFNPNLAFPSPIGDLHFIFKVSCVFTGSNCLTGASLHNAGLLSSIQEANCSGPENLDGVCSGTVLWNTGDNDLQSSFCQGNTSGGTGVSTICAFGSGVDSMWVFKDISVSVGPGHLTSFTFAGECVTCVSAPEPVTMSLMGIGLLGIGLLGHRLRK